MCGLGDLRQHRRVLRRGHERRRPGESLRTGGPRTEGRHGEARLPPAEGEDPALTRMEGEALDLESSVDVAGLRRCRDREERDLAIPGSQEAALPDAVAE